MASESPDQTAQPAVGRRTVLVAGAGAAVAGAVGAAGLPGWLAAPASAEPVPPTSLPAEPNQPAATGAPMTTPTPAYRQPVVFLPHGGGPWPFVEMGFAPKVELDSLANYLKAVAKVPKQTPKALLVISAHWEEPVPTVMTAAAPPMFYDYYGFPPESYKITWPAPGAPQLAKRVQQLLGAAGMATAVDAQRGFDHGTFVPLKLTFPDAEIPTIQLSLQVGLDPAKHLAMGKALAPLRDEGVLIVGSGMTYHNLRAFGPQAAPVAAAFDTWLQAAATAAPAERDAQLTQWSRAPGARQAHPREEHLLPLMVIAGAAGQDVGQTAWTGTIRGLRLSAYHYGAA